MNPPVILTRSGRVFNLEEPSPDAVNIIDITYALARIPRFTGHARSFWSVGQHSLLCHHLAQTLDGSIALHALLHDAAEAYIGDLSSPLKKLLPEARTIESRILSAIYEKLGISPPNIEEEVLIKAIDTAACVAEARFLMPSPAAGFSLSTPNFTQAPDELTADLVEEALLFIPTNLFIRRQGRPGYTSYGELSKKLETVLLDEIEDFRDRIHD